MIGKFVEPQEIAPRHEGGVDHSGTGKILVRFGQMRLVWRKGRFYYSGMLNPKAYAASQLEVTKVHGDGPRSMKDFFSKEIFEGGRLTMNRIGPEIKKIRELMGLPDLNILHIDLKKTYVVEEA